MELPEGIFIYTLVPGFCLMAKRTALLVMALICACAPLTEERGVYRDFLQKTIAPGEVSSVTLRVLLGEGDTFYLLEEFVPEEFEVLDQTRWSGHESTLITYRIRAPAERGTYAWKGEYAMDRMQAPEKVKGETSVLVG